MLERVRAVDARRAEAMDAEVHARKPGRVRVEFLTEEREVGGRLSLGRRGHGCFYEQSAQTAARVIHAPLPGLQRVD